MESVVKNENSVSLVYVAIGINVLISILFHGVFQTYGYSSESIDNMILPVRIIVWATIFCFPEFKDSFFIEPIRRKLKSIVLTWISLLFLISAIFIAFRFLFWQFANLISFTLNWFNYEVSEGYLNFFSLILFFGIVIGVASFVSCFREKS